MAHSPVDEDERWMRRALALAEQAEAHEEVPVGCVVVRAGEMVGEGFNETLRESDPSAHAEIVALRRTARSFGVPRLPGVVLYVTLEPCVMCVGAMIQARVARLVFGCRDPKGGAVVSLYELSTDRRLNHRFPYREGVLAEECGTLLSGFFRKRRELR